MDEPTDYEKQIERYKQMRMSQRVAREQYERDMAYVQGQLTIQAKLIAKLCEDMETMKPCANIWAAPI